MTNILRSEMALLAKEIEFELRLLCREQAIDFESLQGAGSINPKWYSHLLGTHYASKTNTPTRPLKGIGEIGLMCNRLTRLNGASSYQYELKADSTINFSFSWKSTNAQK